MTKNNLPNSDIDDTNLPTRIRWLKDNSVMVLIPSGEFRRGTTPAMIDLLVKEFGAKRYWFKDEHPSRLIHLDAYYIDIYPTTNRQFLQFCRQGRYAKPTHIHENGFNDLHKPVVGIEWEDAVAFCAWVGKKLPTEAEWEKAARGTDGRLFPWGDVFNTEYLNSGSRIGVPTKVGSFPDGSSPYGVHDMSGNVYEWVNDWYDAKYYEKSPTNNPKGPNGGSSRVLRGGSWINVPTMVRCAERDYMRPPELDRVFVGFRSVASVEQVLNGEYEIL